MPSPKPETRSRTVVAKEHADALDNLPEEVQLVIMAHTIVLTRINSLPKADRDELYELFQHLPKAEGAEDQESIHRAMKEILAQVPVKSRSLPEGINTQGLKRWATHIGQTIRKMREDAGLTQVELAGKAGIPQSHLSRLENGEHSATNKTLCKIADALGVDVGAIDPCTERAEVEPTGLE